MDSQQYSLHFDIQTSIGDKNSRVGTLHFSRVGTFCFSRVGHFLSEGWVLCRFSRVGTFVNSRVAFGFVIAGSEIEIWLLPLQFLI